MRRFTGQETAVPVPTMRAPDHPSSSPLRPLLEQGRIQAKLTVSQPDNRNEREADRAAEQVVSNGARTAPRLNINPMTGHNSRQETAGAPAPDLDQKLSSAGGGGEMLRVHQRAYFEPRFGQDLSQVRLHEGAQAAEMNEQIGARAFTHGRDIYFGAGQLDTNTSDGRKLMAHEITHTLQNGSAPNSRLQRDMLSGLKEDIRKGLRISRAAPKTSEIETWVKKYFDASKGSSANTIIPVEVDPVITDAQQKKGLTSVAAELVHVSTATTNAKLSDRPFASNSILDIDIDPSAHGGVHAIYRFIRFTDGKAEKIFVEKLSGAAAAQSNAPVRTPMPHPRPPGKKEAEKAPIERLRLQGDVPVAGISINIDKSFSNAEARTILAAVQLLPSGTQAKIKDVKFVHNAKAKSADGADGKYEPIDDEIVLYGNAFSKGSRKIGIQSTATYKIIHEIGHAIDLRPEFDAERRTKKAKKDKTEQEKIASKVTFDDSHDPLGGLFDEGKSDPVKDKARKEITRLDKEIVDLSRNLGKGKSLSGNEVGKVSESLKTEFGKALKKDGITVVKGAIKSNRAAEKFNKANPTSPQKPTVDTLSGNISLYGNTDLMEAFAESFSIYMLDPGLLKNIRPATFKYFKKNFPKDKKPAAKGTP